MVSGIYWSIAGAACQVDGQDRGALDCSMPERYEVCAGSAPYIKPTMLRGVRNASPDAGDWEARAMMVSGYRQGNEQVWLPGVAADIRYSGHERRAARRCSQQSRGSSWR